MHSGCGIEFDGKDEWHFCNGFPWNVIIFGIFNSLSSHSHYKNKLFILSEGDTFSINGNFGTAFYMNFSKANTKFCLSLHYDGDSYFFVNGKEICKFEVSNKNINFPTQFRLGTLSNKFGAINSREVSLKGNEYNFTVDYNFIDISDILNIYKYLMAKDNM